MADAPIPSPAPWLDADPVASANALNATFVDNLHEMLGMSFDTVGPRHAVARLTVQRRLFAGNGYLHAATLVALADTAAGFGCLASLPEGASGFTTVELKANYLGTVSEGDIVATATLAHGGRSTQVWDATVSAETTGRQLALFRCTQLVLYPR